MMKISKTKEILKVIHFLMMFPLTLLIFNVTINLWGIKTGYWISFVIYWIAITSFTLYYYKPKRISKLYKNTNGNRFWKLLAFIPFTFVFIISFLPTFPKLKFPYMIMVIIIGIINGFCEELFWRGLTLNTIFKNKNIVVITSVFGFGLWHLTLALCNGLVYQGGFASLIGGAVLMGLIWQLTASKTGNILIVTIAHIIVNICAFSTLILENWQI